MDRLEPFLKVDTFMGTAKWGKKNAIPYTVNRFGYRCTHVMPPSTDYILVAGCSHTFGEALKNEERYVTLLENHFQLPVLNIGVRGGSPNLIRDNLLQLMSSGYNLPKFVIIQWPNEYRIWLDTYSISVQSPIKEFYKVDCLKNVSQMSYNHTQWLLKSANIPSFQFKIWLGANDIDMPWIDVVDHAIDGHHPGTITNQNIAKFIRKNMKRLI
mgnify:FL=1|jgi:hypothetical protein